MSGRAPRSIPLGRFEIVDVSMAPALESGDYVFTRRAGRRIKRGSIVIYAISGTFVVKRVVGLGGEHISLDGGVVSIDGRPYRDHFWDGATRPDGEWDVAPDRVFVLGDNRPVSTKDSRQVGSIRVDSIVAIVMGRYWPLRRSSHKS